MATNSTRQGANDRTDNGRKSAEAGAFAIAIGATAPGLHGRLRAGFNPGTDPGCADERAAQRGLHQHLSGEGFRRGEKEAATRSRYKRTAAGRHAGCLAAGQAGPQHERILHAAVTDRSGRRAVQKPDGELRLQQRDRKVRAGDIGPGRGAGTPDHDRQDTRRHGGGTGARQADRRAGEVHRSDAPSRADLASRRHSRGDSGKAAAPVGRDHRDLAQGGYAVAGAAVDKVYCAAVPFISASQQHQAAINAGVPARAIYVEGRGAETFDACLNQFRGGGVLGLVGGLRVLGASRVVIVARLRDMKARGIRVCDLDTGQSDEMELLNAAIQKINGARSLRLDPRRPRTIGRKGGLAKGIAAQARRNAVMAEDIVQRLCAHPKLNWEDRAAILGLPWSESTLRRKYDNN